MLKGYNKSVLVLKNVKYIRIKSFFGNIWEIAVFRLLKSVCKWT